MNIKMTMKQAEIINMEIEKRSITTLERIMVRSFMNGVMAMIKDCDDKEIRDMIANMLDE